MLMMLGKCGCSNVSAGVSCRVVIRRRVYACEPLTWVYERNVVTSPVEESHEHCPDDPSKYKIAPVRALSSELKKVTYFLSHFCEFTVTCTARTLHIHCMYTVRTLHVRYTYTARTLHLHRTFTVCSQDIAHAVRNGRTATQWLTTSRSDSFVVNLAVSNQLPVSQPLLPLANFADTSFNPLASTVQKQFQTEKRKSRLKTQDSAAFAQLMQRFTGLSGLRSFYQEADPDNEIPELRAEIAVIGTEGNLANAPLSGRYIVALDAAFGLNAYGFPHWELVGNAFLPLFD